MSDATIVDLSADEAVAECIKGFERHGKSIRFGMPE